MRKIFLFALAVAATLVSAQENRFVIRGEMSCDSLLYSDGVVKSVNLVKDGADGPVTIATAEVSQGRFTFEGIAPEQPETYNITGFNNGAIQVFVEPGEITVGPFDARYPVAAKIGGTPCNEIYQGYLDVNDRCINESRERMKRAYEQIPAHIKGDIAAEQQYTSPTFYVNNLHFKVAIMDFIYQHIDSPVVLYIIKYSMHPTFTADVIEKEFLQAIPEHLHSHKMYKELVNQVRADNLKVGAYAPDISGTTPDGKEVTLSQLKGKYVFLDFWASWCAPCRREIPFLKEALAKSENSDKFVILSYSIDNKEKDWLNCIEKNQLTHKNWIHISTLKGWNSEAIKLFGAEGVPYTVLIDPDGKVMQFGLRGEGMVKKIESIVK